MIYLAAAGGFILGVIATLWGIRLFIEGEAKAKEKADFKRITRPSPYRDLMASNAKIQKDQK